MSLIISTGSNIGDRKSNLLFAKEILSKKFIFIASSRIYESPAVDYLDQPDFLNQLLEFKIPDMKPEETMSLILEIEKDQGRIRDISKGPRTIDIDIIFWNTESFKSPTLILPHPSWAQRSFIVRPLQELPYFSIIEQNFSIPSDFDHTCYALET